MTAPLKKVLFISSSDITVDSRILKQISVVESCGLEWQAIGVKERELFNLNANKNIILIDPFFRITKSSNKSWIKNFFINVIRMFFMSPEVLVKFLYHSIKFKPKIVHCSNYHFLPIAVFLKIFTSARLIYDIHELESQTTAITKLSSNYIMCLEKIFWPFVDISLHVSKSIELWYEIKIGHKKSEIILNSPVLSNEFQSGNYFRNYYGISHELKIFLYLGMLSRYRGIGLALEVFSKLEDSAVIIFMGYGEMKEEIQQYSKKYSNIHVHHAVPHDKVIAIASSADFGYCMLENVSLSDYYCLPNKLFEYAFSRLPVIASNFPDISEVVTKFELGVVSDFDENSIRFGISDIIVKKSLGNFLNKDLSSLSWEQQSEKLKKVLNQLV